MAQNHEIANDWGWFPSLMDTPRHTDEVILMRDGQAYKATQKQMMQADGQGWVWYVDSANTSSNKQSISSGVNTQLTIDKLGGDTFTEYRDGLPADIWNNNTFNPHAVGESYLFRLQFMLSQSSSGSGKYADVSIDIGDGGENVIWDSTYSIIKGQGVDAFVSFTIPVFVREGFYNNGAKFYIEANVDIDIWDRRIMIQRMSQP